MPDFWLFFASPSSREHGDARRLRALRRELNLYGATAATIEARDRRLLAEEEDALARRALARAKRAHHPLGPRNEFEEALGRLLATATNAGKPITETINGIAVLAQRDRERLLT